MTTHPTHDAFGREWGKSNGRPNDTYEAQRAAVTTPTDLDPGAEARAEAWADYLAEQAENDD